MYISWLARGFDFKILMARQILIVSQTLNAVSKLYTHGKQGYVDFAWVNGRHHLNKPLFWVLPTGYMYEEI